MNDHLPSNEIERLHFYRQYWHLVEDGIPFHTRSSCLQAVLFNETPAILKLALSHEECVGAQLMVWWEGDGAARVLAQHENAIVLERAIGHQSLADMARQGQDEEASRILCRVATRLHAHQKQPPENLYPLSQWYKSLLQNAPLYGGVFVESAAIATQLLTAPQDVTVLHGDIHHGNVLDFGSRGWLAVDPKGLLGERAFDFANILCNPDQTVTKNPERFMRQIEVISKTANLNSDRLLAWVASWAGLSAIWSIEDGENPDSALTIADIALGQLRGK